MANRKKAMGVTSPSEWSYDAPLRCLSQNDKFQLNERVAAESEAVRTTTAKNSDIESPNQFYCNSQHRSSSILTLLSTVQFGPSTPSRSNDSDSESFGSWELGSESVMHSSDSDVLNIDPHHNAYAQEPLHTARHWGDGDLNKTYLIAAILLLCSSGVSDAAHIAYITRLYEETGVAISLIFLVQGIVQTLVCLLLFAIAATTLICRSSFAMATTTIGGPTTKRVTLKSLMLPFCSMTHTIHFLTLYRSVASASGKKHQLRRCRYKIMQHDNKYGAVGTSRDYDAPAHTKTDTLMTMSVTRMLCLVFVFGLVACCATWMVVTGFLYDTQLGDNSMRSLLCSLTIALVFIWSHFLHHPHHHRHHHHHGNAAVNAEQLLCVLLLYIGVFLCGFALLGRARSLWNFSNIYLLIAALLNSLAFVLVKCVQKVPTFLLVCSQSIFSLIFGFVFYKVSSTIATADDSASLNSFYDLFRIASSGLLVFISSWTFVRGTQLIAVTTAVFLKIAVFTLSMLVIQAVNGGTSRPHLFGAFGIAFVAFSVVLLLIEKFGQTKRVK